MIDFRPASVIKSTVDTVFRERDLFAEIHAMSSRKLFYFNPRDLILSHISYDSSLNMWQNIAALPDGYLHHMLRNSEIDEILITEKYIFMRSKSGLASVYTSSNYSFSHFLNIEEGEQIRSIYFNNVKNEVIKVSVMGSDHFSALHCFAVDPNSPTKVRELFKGIKIIYPGFVEFDMINNRAIILEGRTNKYFIWSLDDYNVVYSIQDNTIFDMKMTPGVVLILKNCRRDRIAIEFRGLKSQKCNIALFIREDKALQFVDNLELSVIVKQKDMNVKFYDIGSLNSVEILGTSHLNTADFIFLYASRRILIYKNGVFNCYSFQGEFLFTISTKRRLLCSPIALSKSQKLIVTYSVVRFNHWINIFSLEDGKMLYNRLIPPGQSNGQVATSIAFDESNNVLLIGDDNGRVSIYK